jgi:hypothetical protein
LAKLREKGRGASMYPQMYVQPKLSVDIAFKQGPPAFGRPVRTTLKHIRDEVATVLENLRPFV